VRESLGAALLLAKDTAAAEAVFHARSRRSPNNGRMLFGLLEALQTQQKTQGAAEIKKEFYRARSGSDITLRLASLQSPAPAQFLFAAKAFPHPGR